MGRKDRIKREARDNRESGLAEPQDTAEDAAPEDISRVISRLKEAAAEDVHRIENMSIEEVRQMLERSRKAAGNIAEALAKEQQRKAALMGTFTAHGLEVPPRPELEESPAEISAREAVAAASSAASQAGDAPGDVVAPDAAALRQQWALSQATGRCQLAMAKVERAHCHEMERMLQEKGIPLPAAES